MSGGPYDAAFWDRRYAAADGHVFGTAPNDFLAATADHIPRGGRVLCLGEGEGRNAVFLARRGHDVLALDQSAVGLGKAAALAARHGVAVATEVADLAARPLEPSAWDAVVAIFLHLPPALRGRVHRSAAAALRPGGVLILESYGPGQLGRGTGGPQDAALLAGLAEIVPDLAGLELLTAGERERAVVEGPGHTGRAFVVQVLARRPA
jgi:SAM-dependent methyltransferase